MSELFMELQHRRRLSHMTEPQGSGASTGDAYDDISPMSSFYARGSENGHTEAELEATDELTNLLSLKLKKPKHWKWELATSRSCASIAMPRILLYDHKGKLLVDVNSQEEQVYTPQVGKQQRKARKRSIKAATANLEQSIQQALDEEFNGLYIQEATPSTTLSPPASRRERFTLSRSATSNSVIDFNTNDLPDGRSDTRSGSSKSVRFLVEDEADTKNSTGSSFRLASLLTPPSTTTTATSTTTSSEPRQKRRYRRSRSSGRSPTPHSGSILERFSFNRGRFSSPEYAEEQEVYRPPRYFLRTSKAGTLVVQEDSLRRYQRRRRPKISSSENLLNESGTKSHSSSSLKTAHFTAKMPQRALIAEPHAGSLQDVAVLRGRNQYAQPIRRYRSDANVMLSRHLPHGSFSSDEDCQPQRAGYRTSLHHRSQGSFKKQRSNLVPLDGGHSALDHALKDSATAR